MRIAILSWLHDERAWRTDQLLDLAALLGSRHCSPSSIIQNLAPDERGKALLRGSIGSDATPVIRADPAGRCIAVLAKEQSAIYVIPVLGEDDSRMVNRGDIFLIDLPNDYEASNVKDFTFLNDSFEPNILILYEPRRTWAGRAAVKKDTCQLLNITVDLRSRKTSKTWTMEGLPYDCEKLVPIPESAEAGALVISASVILQVRHGACIAGLSLNCFGDAFAKEVLAKYDTITASDQLAVCDACHCRFLDVEEQLDSSNGMQSTALLSLKGGELYFLNIAVGSRSTISMKRAGSTVMASEIVPINSRFFVLASRLSDSLLIEYQPAADDEPTDAGGGEDGQAAADGDAPKQKSTKSKKRKRTAEEEAEYEMIYGTKPPQDSSDEESEAGDEQKQSALELEEKVEGTRGVYDDEDELGWVFASGTETGDATDKSKGSRKWALKVKDTLPCFGPGADLAVGPSPEDVTATKLDMVIAGGYGKNGCLAVVHQTIRPTYHKEFELSGCNGVWALLDPAVAKQERIEREKQNRATRKRNEARQLRNAKKMAERQRFVEEAIIQLRRERKEREAREIEEAKLKEGDGDDEDKPNEDATQPESMAETDDLDSSVNGDAGEEEEKRENKTTNEKEPPDQKRDKDENTEDIENQPLKRARTENGSPIANGHNGDVQLDDDRPLPDDVKAEIERQAEASYPLEAEEGLEEEVQDAECLHSYMLLSTPTSTAVLKILKNGVLTDEYTGISADFVTNEKTITAQNILEGDSIVQVVPTTVRVLRRGKIQCEYSFADKGTLVKRAQVCDPLVLVHTNDDRLFILCISANKYEESSLEESADPGIEEDLVDEYGMSFSETKRSNSLEDQAASDDSKKGRTRVGYRDFKISAEFSEERNRDVATSVAAAYIYKGFLASQIASDGILKATEQALGTPVDEDLSKKAESTAEEATKELGDQDEDMKESTSEPGAHHIEDEDRMLYGNDNEDEDDLMLYGAADTEGDKNDKEKTKGHVKNEDGEPQTGVEDETHVVRKTGGATQKQAVGPPEKGVEFLPEVSAPNSELKGEHLLIVANKDGSLFVLSRSLEYAVVLHYPVFFAAPSLLHDANPSNGTSAGRKCPPASKSLSIEDLTMVELSGSALLPGIATPVLVATSALGIPLVYKAYMAGKRVSGAARSRLVLKKVNFRDRSAHLLSLSVKNAATRNDDGGKDLDADGNLRCRNHFQNIAGRGGLFVGGRCPFFVFAERGHPRVHALTPTITSSAALSQEEYESGEGVVAFTEFHNTNCPRGFVMVNENGMVRIGELPPPSVMNFDAPAPMRKITLRCTPHKVAYHSGSATYGVLASMPTLTRREERLARILQSLEKHDKRHYLSTAAQAEAETGDDRASRVPPLFEELHELRVYRPDTWELIKTHKLHKGEVGLAIANMVVDVYKPKTASAGNEIPSSKRGDDGNESPFAASLKLRPKNMLVVGTGYLNGEDASSRGRLLLFEISKQEIYTEDQGVYTAFQMQLIAEKELFSPVTAVAAMEGYVIAGVGPQVSVYKLVGDEIIHLSFAFGQLYCSSLSSLKQYVVAADMCKSVSFMYFRERNNSLNFLGKDYEHVTSYATEFLIENDNMSIVVSDGKGNFQMMNFAHASVPESRGGKRLLINGGLNFGGRVNKLIRLRAPDRRAVAEGGRKTVTAGKHSLLFTTLDGGIGGVIAMTQTEFKKLEKLHKQMVSHPGVPRYAGANPDEHAAFRPESPSTVLLDQRLLDGRAIFDYYSVSLVEMRMIAREMGGKMKDLVDSFIGVDMILSRF